MKPLWNKYTAALVLLVKKKKSKKKHLPKRWKCTYLLHIWRHRCGKLHKWSLGLLSQFQSCCGAAVTFSHSLHASNMKQSQWPMHETASTFMIIYILQLGCKYKVSFFLKQNNTHKCIYAHIKKKKMHVLGTLQLLPAFWWLWFIWH